MLSVEKKFKCFKKKEIVHKRHENIVSKGKKADNQHIFFFNHGLHSILFSFVSEAFKKIFIRNVKTQDCLANNISLCKTGITKYDIVI